MKVAYFGLPLGALLLLADGIGLECAVLPPVEAPGRRRLAQKLGTRVLDARATDDPTAFEDAVDAALAEAQPELVVSWFFTRKLASRWIEPPRRAIGVHPSLLPRHRGPDPFFWAIDSGDLETGVTVHELVEAYDEGDILMKEGLAIGNRNAWQLARALDRPSLRLLRRAVRSITRGELLPGSPQDPSRATWAGAPEGDQLRADFHWPTDRVLRKIRALAPVPGLALDIRGVHLFVTRAARASDYPAALHPGEAAIAVDGVVIRTGDGAVRLERVVLCDEGDIAQEIGANELSNRLRGH